jgi:hypothetical protein
MKKVWEATSCPIDNCASSVQYTTKDGLVKHLVKVHGHDQKTANFLAACGSVDTLTIDVQDRHIVRTYRPKPWEVSKHDRDGEMENGDQEV